MNNPQQSALKVVGEGMAQEGLSKREYAAVALMQGLVSMDPEAHRPEDYVHLADRAVRAADALFARLER